MRNIINSCWNICPDHGILHHEILFQVLARTITWIDHGLTSMWSCDIQMNGILQKILNIWIQTRTFGTPTTSHRIKWVKDVLPKCRNVQLWKIITVMLEVKMIWGTKKGLRIATFPPVSLKASILVSEIGMVGTNICIWRSALKAVRKHRLTSNRSVSYGT